MKRDEHANDARLGTILNNLSLSETDGFSTSKPPRVTVRAHPVIKALLQSIPDVTSDIKATITDITQLKLKASNSESQFDLNLLLRWLSQREKNLRMKEIHLLKLQYQISNTSAVVDQDCASHLTKFEEDHYAVLQELRETAHSAGLARESLDRCAEPEAKELLRAEVERLSARENLLYEKERVFLERVGPHVRELSQSQDSNSRSNRDNDISHWDVLRHLDRESPQKATSALAAERLYKCVAENLAGDSVVKRVVSEVKSHYNALRRNQDADLANTFYYAVEAPSGSGKTLLPYALSAAGLTIRQFVLHPADEAIQDIYRVHLNRSSILRTAMDNDMQCYPGLQESCSSVELFEACPYRALQTVAVVSKLMKFSTVTGDPQVLREQVFRAEEEDLPLFVIDEVLSGKPSHAEYTRLKYLRNILRGAGILGMYMGTNSNIEKFLSQVGLSRNSGAASLWCRVITRLPSVTEQSLAALGVLQPLTELGETNPEVARFLHQQCMTCNPLFAELCGSAVCGLSAEQRSSLTSTALLSTIVEHMASAIYIRKSALRTVPGMRAQLCQHFDKHRILLPGPPPVRDSDDLLQDHLNAAFIGAHFAVLTEEPGPLVLLGDYKLAKNGSNQQWQACTAFPSLQTDCLMFLMLSGCVTSATPPYCTGGKARTTAGALQLALRHQYDALRTTAVMMENVNAFSRSGDRLEGIATAAIVNASHCSGLEGSSLADFMIALVRELCVNGDRARALQWDPTRKPSVWLDDTHFKVPFLSAANDSWPESLAQVPGVHVAEYVRPKNSGMLDGHSRGYEPVVHGIARSRAVCSECKNYSSPVPLPEIREILRRVRSDCFIHVVVVSKLQQQYWAKADGPVEWRRFRGDNLVDTAVVRLTYDPSSCRIGCSILSENCLNVARKNCRRIAIFVEYDSFN